MAAAVAAATPARTRTPPASAGALATAANAATVAMVKTNVFIQNPFLSIVSHRRNWVLRISSVRVRLKARLGVGRLRLCARRHSRRFVGVACRSRLRFLPIEGIGGLMTTIAHHAALAEDRRL